MLPNISQLSLNAAAPQPGAPRPPPPASLIPGDVWNKILSAVNSDQPCSAIATLCQQNTELANICRDVDVFDRINKQLGWYGMYKWRFIEESPEPRRGEWDTFAAMRQAFGGDAGIIKHLADAKAWFAFVCNEVGRVRKNPALAGEEPREFRYNTVGGWYAAPFLEQWAYEQLRTYHLNNGLLQFVDTTRENYAALVESASIANGFRAILIETTLGNTRSKLEILEFPVVWTLLQTFFRDAAGGEYQAETLQLRNKLNAINANPMGSLYRGMANDAFEWTDLIWRIRTNCMQWMPYPPDTFFNVSDALNTLANDLTRLCLVGAWYDWDDPRIQFQLKTLTEKPPPPPPPPPAPPALSAIDHEINERHDREKRYWSSWAEKLRALVNQQLIKKISDHFPSPEVSPAASAVMKESDVQFFKNAEAQLSERLRELLNATDVDLAEQFLHFKSAIAMWFNNIRQKIEADRSSAEQDAAVRSAMDQANAKFRAWIDTLHTELVPDFEKAETMYLRKTPNALEKYVVFFARDHAGTVEQPDFP
jgi:hypothetical protein